MEKVESRAVIKYLQKKGLRPKDIHEDMVKTCGKTAPAYPTVKKWAAEFKRGRQSLEDDPRSGRPVTVRTQGTIDLVHDLVMSDRRMTIRHIAAELGISRDTVHQIITEDLEMRKVSARWVPKLLTLDQKRARTNMSRENLQRFQADPEDFVQRFVTMDETWVHHVTPETKEQSKQWKHVGSPTPKKAKVTPSAGKVMASVFWDADGIILVDYLEKGRTLTGQYYASLLWQLRANLIKKRHGKVTRGVLYHQDNAPAHKSAVAMAAIHNCGFELLDHPPYSPDLAPSDYHLFPNLKKSLAGSRYASDDEVMEATEAFLGAQDKAFFQAGIRALEHRWAKCIEREGDYVEK